MVQEARVRRLNDQAVRGDGRYVLYWMQQAQRARFNHALEYAAGRANSLGRPLVVGFGLMDDYPEANERHYAFMLQGLRDVAADLQARGVPFLMRLGQPPDVAIELARRASLVVCDGGYLRHQKRWRDHVADHAGVRLVEVESDVVVPADVASDKQEFAARTIRPKIRRHWDEYLVPLKTVRLKHQASRPGPLADRSDHGSAIDPSDVEGTLKRLKIDRSVPRSTRFTGGSRAATLALKHFIRSKLTGYDDERNEPAAAHSSMLSPYLHFGQISPVEVALSARGADAPDADRAAYLEELIVRRELAVNFVHHCPNYDSFDSLPRWARKTLRDHSRDRREHLYPRAELEAAATHDEYWNAAQREMTATGYMHNYMRMYWGKRILEWSRSGEEAYATTLYLNNKYFLDGRDPSAYANVGWIYGLHDRPWGPARPVFGTVRYMNAAGLERKFDMRAYVERVRELATLS
jgi:deoxyribodipyrimidine photo-lyase